MNSAKNKTSKFAKKTHDTPKKRLLSNFHKNFDYVCQALIFTVIFTLSPLIVLLSFFSYTLRYVVKHLAKVYRKDLGHMVNAQSILHAVDSINSAPKCNLVAVFVTEGSIDVENVRSTLEDRLNHLPKDSKGNTRYRESKQYLVQWAGYYFWKTDPHFKLSDQITVLSEDKEYTEEDVKDIGRIHLQRSWPTQKPMWELLVIPNYKPSYSLKPGHHSCIIFTYHHSMADGYSFLHFMNHHIAKKDAHLNVTPTYVERPLSQLISYYLSFPFLACWEVAGIVTQCLKPYDIRDNHQLENIRELGEREEESRFKFEATKSLPISLIKKVKSHYGTSFAAVMHSAVAGALREYQLQKEWKVPQLTPCVVVVPYPGYKFYKFQNHASAVLTYLPTFAEDSLDSLHFAESDFKRCKFSTVPAVIFNVNKVVGWCIIPIARLLVKTVWFPAGLTTMPGGLEFSYLFDKKVIDVMTFTGMMEGGMGITFVSFSYIDRFRITVVGRPTIFSQSDLNHICKLIEQYFIKLGEELHST